MAQSLAVTRRQMPLFNGARPETAREARDLAVARVGRSAGVPVMDLLRKAVRATASERSFFIVDEVWGKVDASTIGQVDKRAMGAAMVEAARQGVIAPTDEYRASEQKQCHGNPRRVWRSLL